MAAYEEAFRINPTDVTTLAGLGRLYMAAEDWEKARRVFRSKVLQNIEPALGAGVPAARQHSRQAPKTARRGARTKRAKEAPPKGVTPHRVVASRASEACTARR